MSVFLTSPQNSRPLMNECSVSGCLHPHTTNVGGASTPNKYFYPDLLMTTVSAPVPTQGVCRDVLEDRVDLRVEASEGRLYVVRCRGEAPVRGLSGLNRVSLHQLLEMTLEGMAAKLDMAVELSEMEHRAPVPYYCPFQSCS